MATLHVDLNFGLSVEHTRNVLGSYSRGCPLDSFIRYMPKVEIPKESDLYFDTTNSSVVLFLSDFFGKESPFDIQLTMEDGVHVDYVDCNILLIEAKNIIGLKITNKSIEDQRAHIML